MDYQYLIVEQDGPVARITINRPEVLNALNRASIEELGLAMERAGADTTVRAVVLTGSGQKAFIAGADISELAALSAHGAREFARMGQQVLDRIQWLGKPVIAAVNGFALGGGCEVALACHLRIGSTKARMGQPEVNLGVIPGWGGTQRLPRLVGMGRALEVLLTGEPIPADEAFRIGLLNRVVEPEALLETAGKIAGTIASRGPLAVRFTLEAALRGFDADLAGGCRIEADCFGLAAASADWKEGTGAFLEKRKPEFTGR